MGIPFEKLNATLQKRIRDDNPDAFCENSVHNHKRLHSYDPKPVERNALVSPPPREEACWHDAAKSFEVVFTVYAVRPCDWDGYDIKSLQDFLCAVGIIPGDGWKTLSGRVVSRKASTPEEEKTVIEIKAINP